MDTSKSYVHAIIKFKNGLIKLIAHETDMRIPIFNSIYNSNIKTFKSKKININFLNNLNFSKADPKQYPLINILKKFLKNETYLKQFWYLSMMNWWNYFSKKRLILTICLYFWIRILNSKIFSKYRLKKVNNFREIQKLNEFVRLKTNTLSVISKSLWKIYF